MLQKMRNKQPRGEKGETLVILIDSLFLAEQEAVRKAQEELTKQKEVIMAKDKELKVRKKLHYLKMFHTLPNGF